MESKFPLPEVIFVGMCFLLLEALDFIPIIGPVASFLITQLYLGLKGVSGTYQLILAAANASEVALPPPFNWLPIRTAAFILIVILDHLPPKIKVVAEVAAAAAVTGGAAAPAVGAAAGGTAGVGGATAGAAATKAGAAGVGEVAAGAEATAAGAAKGIEEAGGTAAKGATAAEKEIAPEALGEEESIFEKLKKPLEQLPEPEKKEGVKNQEETIDIDEENNQIDLRKAA